MKKISLLLGLCVLLAFNAFAAFSNPAVVDEAGYLYQYELDELNGIFDEIRNTYNIEVAVYTEDIMSGYDAESSADDIYDYSDYGYNGIMLYICSDTREYHFSTHGTGLKIFNDNGLAYIESKVLPYLQNDDYYGAMAAFAKYAEELIIMAENGAPYNEKAPDTGFVITVIVIAALLPLIIAFCWMRSRLKKMKTAVGEKFAGNYMKPGSMDLRVSRDMFLFSTITRTEKPKSNSSGTHTSSSGRTHGGRGGSF